MSHYIKDQAKLVFTDGDFRTGHVKYKYHPIPTNNSFLLAFCDMPSYYVYPKHDSLSNEDKFNDTKKYKLMTATYFSWLLRLFNHAVIKSPQLAIRSRITISCTIQPALYTLT